MRYYSDKTHKFYDTAADCERAEFEAKEAENREKIKKERELAFQKEKKEKEAAERKALAAEVDEARKAMVAAQNVYREKLDEFVKRYKTYHYSTNKVEDIPTLFGLFDNLFF
jgi:hypothetical protein